MIWFKNKNIDFIIKKMMMKSYEFLKFLNWINEFT